ncbi:hypothetical protein EDD17DRAFT_797655 [Pisolithus thermaeus]|nr:hypothetical protein EV401DRAFT_431197 [Pisolithus croceorrhizus]KAI6160610.1 hypothetical protein EDD17DRAFT_797655 [Pisolithus thermaeus]
MVGHPYGSDVTAGRWNLSNGANIVVVDMPSSHIDHDNDDVDNKIADWLKSNFTGKCCPGILFLHSLDSNLARDHMLIPSHLETFAKAFHNEFTVPSRVYIMPTSIVDPTLSSEILSQRLLQLNTVVEGLKGDGNRKWHASLFPGVFKGQPEMAWSVLLLLLKDMSQTQAEGSISPPIRPALERMSPQLPNDRLALKDFADLLFKEFREIGRNSDLDAITILGRTALELSLPGHPQNHLALSDLADLLLEQFKKEGTKGGSGEITTLKRAALECIPQNHPKRQTILLELDDCLYERFRREHAMADLEEIITLRRAVLELTPPPDRCRQLLNLANSLHEKFEKRRLVNDINEAVSLAIDALGLCCPGHPDYPLSQDHLATYLKAKVRTRDVRAHASDTSSSVPLDIKERVKHVFFEKAEKLPPRLLHTPTGVLCNRDAQLSHFEHSLQYKQLLSSTFPRGSQQLETEINDTISEFFGFTTLSHRWGVGEPLLRDIEGKRIYELGGTDGLAKLQDFCILALRHSFQWAWSDTCCIDKDSSAELQEAIGSMFSWYHRSSLTIVYLADVAGTGSLANSVWFKRGWTLQELLASETVFFYASDWSPYMNSDAANHKTDPALLEELCQATQIAEHHLRNFDPGMEDARSRLCWASHRRTTRPEDMAYSLFGIFGVQLPVLYGETSQNALGRLLAEIVSRSGDVSVLDWAGEESSFNSCFPANLVPYQAMRHIQLTSSDPAGREGLDFEKARKLYNDLARLPLARCVHRRIVLPSIVYRVTAVTQKVGSSDNPLRYTNHIRASRLMPLEVISAVNLDEGADKYILVRPWHPKSLRVRTGSDDDAIWNLLEQLEQPFNALLLERLLHNEYKRIACDCTITARVHGPASILDSEVLTLEVV